MLVQNKHLRQTVFWPGARFKAGLRRLAGELARSLLTVLTLLVPPVAAYEVGTAQDNGSAEFRGQVLVPSRPGLTPADPILPTAEFPPLSLSGRAYLTAISIRVADGFQAPAMLHVFAQLPDAGQATTGAGALASTSLRACRSFSGPGQGCEYRFAPLALPFDQPVFAIFSECATTVLSAPGGADDYPAGQPIVDSDCANPEAGTLSTATGPGDAAFVARFLNPSPNRVADYRAGRNGQATDDGLPMLSGPGLGSSSDELIDGQLTPTHEMAGGVELPTAPLIPAGNYLLSALIRLDSTQGFSKLLDFKNLQSDNGLYVNDSQLQFIPGGDNSQPDASQGVWQSVVLERIAGAVRARIDGKFQFFVLDSAEDGLPDGNQLLQFFIDDQITGGSEDPQGRWARIQVFQNSSGIFGQPPRLPAEGADQFENDNLPSRADLGQEGVAGSYRTFHLPDDEDWLYGAVPCDIPNYWSQSGTAALVLSSSDPRFAPLVEYYPQSALANPSPQPEQTFGSCDTSDPLLIPPINDSFVRIRNCDDPSVSPAAPIHYQIDTLQPDAVVCSPAQLIQGTVTEAGSGSPVGGVFILGDDNSAGFSSPVNGAYKILVTDFDQMTLNVVSPAWTAPEAVVEAMDLLIGTPVNFEVTRRSVLFGDGFEVRSNPFAGATP